MTDQQPPAVLETKGQAREILARIRPAFRKHVRQHTKEKTGEQLGGGAVLGARWDHRRSRDVNVHLHIATIVDGRTILDQAAAACGGYRMEHPRIQRIEFEPNEEKHIDVSFNRAEPSGDERNAIVDGEATLVLSTTQIMTGKLSGRGLEGPARDLVDIAACGRADPAALEAAVNALPEEMLNAVLTIYKERKGEYAIEARELEGIAAGLKRVIENPAAYAGDAIIAAKYTQFEIRTTTDGVEVQTWTSRGTRSRRYETAERLRDGLERDGLNAFLTAQYRGPCAVLESAMNALATKQTGTVLEIEPDRLRHKTTKLPPTPWTPTTSRERSATG